MLKYLKTNSKKEILKYKPAIFKLFNHAFGKEIKPEFWDMYYLKNIYGSALVGLVFDSHRLVGHSALVPQIMNSNKESKRCLLFMTSMIDEKYRRYGIYFNLNKMLINYAKELKYDFALAFPNKNAYLPITKLLGWEVMVETRFIKYGLNNLRRNNIYRLRIKRIPFSNFKPCNKLSLPYDSDYFSWRSSINQYECIEINNILRLIYKPSNDYDAMDIMDINSNNNIPQIKLEYLLQVFNKKCCIIPEVFLKHFIYSKNKVKLFSNYILRLCGYALNKELPKNFHFSLLISDVY